MTDLDEIVAEIISKIQKPKKGQRDQRDRPVERAVESLLEKNLIVLTGDRSVALRTKEVDWMDA